MFDEQNVDEAENKSMTYDPNESRQNQFKQDDKPRTKNKQRSL